MNVKLWHNIARFFTLCNKHMCFVHSGRWRILDRSHALAQCTTRGGGLHRGDVASLPVAVNIAAVLVSLCLALRMARQVCTRGVYSAQAFQVQDIVRLALILLFVCVPVHAIKMFRLYLAQYGSNVKLREHAAVYCAASLAGITWPFKCGEIYKMYIYGREADSTLRGIVIALLDRFMDTAGLVSVIILLQLLDGAESAAGLPFFGVLVILMAFLVSCYLLFDSLYRFWNTQLLHRTASRRNVAALGIIEHMRVLHEEVRGVLRGRGVVMYFLSIASYIIEATSMMVFTRQSISPRYMTEYIASPLHGTPSVELSRFIIASVVLLTVLLIIMLLAARGEHTKGGVPLDARARMMSARQSRLAKGGVR